MNNLRPEHRSSAPGEARRTPVSAASRRAGSAGLVQARSAHPSIRTCRKRGTSRGERSGRSVLLSPVCATGTSYMSGASERRRWPITAPAARARQRELGGRVLQPGPQLVPTPREVRCVHELRQAT